ncbi:MAG: DUF6282 family protein [Acidimicrobiales bacterium]
MKRSRTGTPNVGSVGSSVTLEGAYDLHVHSYPDLMARVADDLELAERAREAGMAGFVLKSHYAPTADRAWLVRKVVPGIQVVGSVVLNYFVGGLNPLAVEALGRAGGRMVFMPTSDAANEAQLLDTWDYEEKPLPPYLQIKKELGDQGRLPPAISLLDTEGQLTKQALGVLEVVRDYDLVLATGHIGWSEMRVLIPEAQKLGIRRILVTHPESPSIDLSVDQQLHLLDFGVYIERCFAYLSLPGRMERALDAIRRTGPDRNVLSSDLGALGRPHPQTGLREFMTAVVDSGFALDDVALMACRNPARLLN